MRIYFLLWLAFLFPGITFSQDTFSICAVDPATGEVGSAGASCIANCIIISDVHPGVGVVHTQSYWLSTNKAFCNMLMNQGFSPQEILDSVVANDAQNDSTLRQYGAVDLVGGGRSAAFTGSNCMTYASHVTGITYAIQGNILLGQQILDSMETRFNGSTMPLAHRLMAALQGAKVIGADTRCTDDGKSAISAFVRVARPGDTTGVLFLDLRVNNTPYQGIDPIDSLQILFDQWKATGANQPAPVTETFRHFPNPVSETLVIEAIQPNYAGIRYTFTDVLGRVVASGQFSSGQPRIQLNTSGFAPGLYSLSFLRDNVVIQEDKVLCTGK